MAEESRLTTERRVIDGEPQMGWGGDTGIRWEDEIESSTGISVEDANILIPSTTAPDTEVYLREEEGASAAFSSDSTSWAFSLDSPSSEGHAELMAGIVNPVGFSEVEVLKVDWKLSADGSTAANFGADALQGNINDIDIDSDVPAYSLQKKLTGGFQRTVDEISIGGDSEPQYVGVGSELSTSLNRESTLVVFDVWGEDDSGNTIWSMGIPSDL